MRRALGPLLGALLGSTPAFVAAAAEGFASLSAYGAYGAQHPHPQSQRLVGLFEGSLDLGSGLRVHGQAYFEIDTEDELEPGQSGQRNRSQASRRWLIDQGGAAELDELYVDARIADWDLRIGKQQTVWGTSDGLKVLDIVNPQSFREFILDDYERSRIPLWSIAAVRPFGERNSLELLLIPDLTFHDIPEPGALFEITSPQLTPQGGLQSTSSLDLLVERVGDSLLGDADILDPALAPLAPQLTPLAGLTEPLLRPALIDLLTPLIVERTERPASPLRHPELGARLRGGFGAFEGALCLLHHQADVPAVSVDLQADRVDVRRRYLQTTSFGGQLSHPAGPILLRFEGVYGTRSPLPALDLRGDGLSAVARSYGAVLGADLPVRDAGLVSMQLGQLGLITDARHYDVPNHNPFATLLWRDEIVPNRLTGEIFSAVSLERGDLMLRARLLWMLSDALLLRMGLDGFEGSDQGVFGQFEDRDRLSLELIWSI